MFDTRRRSDLHQALRVEPPPFLRLWSRSPIATLGRQAARDIHPASGNSESAGGLAFHRHERNWLLLLSGRKRWFFRTGDAEPATALERVSEEHLASREATSD